MVPFFPKTLVTRARIPLPPLLLATLAACSSPKNGLAMLELRGAVFGENGTYVAAEGQNTLFGWSGEFERRSIGLRGSINTPVIDLIGGVDQHRFDDEPAKERSLGLRKRLPASDDDATLYVEAALRWGEGLETKTGTRDYEGMQAGTGALFPIGNHWYIDAGVHAEWTFDRYDVPDERDHLSKVVFHLGIGVWI
ncbi:MAG TPA: hypothetical protein VK843_04485 [Planctomycetota bacterium]|nr:hypothetical protein [Planctomycetota bacterium]